MAVFFIKIVSIAVRTLARPLINWVTYYNRLKMQESSSKSAIFIKNILVWMGQNFNYYNSLINRKIFGLTKQAIKPLTNDKALEKGAELMSEFIVYSILLSIPVVEVIRSQKNGVIKEQKKKEFMINLQEDICDLVEKNIENGKNIRNIKNRLQKLNNNLI